ncbi:acyl carrier protein [Acinetobacter baumannii]|uniref:acyl carrier protein n=1 Tax=Acinetobacter baumannii TaxID=470 RepID=UPI000A36A09A|nr:acyl carrier protein [Acinetobacter baumannii]MDC4887275.1 acyl carrier protein [Acinetobacter baumannii]MDC4925690.1 acyl carrier protein [Acinetobacter baumannii]MDC4938797.1 acyl carrier protein [Acinetobacter baumannii]MDC4943985.1 acyl carrier protein [Acinetobacter baumannii]MDC5061528.1 acyl carrier protein [Acinetobacter baumannii]
MSSKRKLTVDIFNKYLPKVIDEQDEQANFQKDFELLGIDSMRLIEFLLELQDTLKVDLMAHAMTKNKISNLNDVIEIVNSLDEKV